MRGVIALELLLILMVAMYFIVMVNTGVQNAGFKFAEDFDKLSAARAVLDKMASGIRFVTIGASGSATKIDIYLPPDVNVLWNGNTLTVEVKTQLEYNGASTHTMSRQFPLDFESPGSISTPGWHEVTISKVADKIRVST